MTELKRDASAYDFVVSYAAMEYSARVARRGKYSAPIVDELVLRIIHAAEEVSLSSLGALLRLTGAQLEAFMEPLLRGGLLRFAESGLVTLGPQGQSAMRQAAGEPPRLTRVEEATEVCSVDVFDLAFVFRPSDRRTSFRYLEVIPKDPSDRAVIRESVREKLLDDYFDHQQYLEIYGLRKATPRQIEYVIDIDEGVGDRGELSVLVKLNDLGEARIEYPDLQAVEQLQKRRLLLAQVELTLSAAKTKVSEQSRDLFLQLAGLVSRHCELDSGSEALQEREYWVDDAVLVTGRLESRSLSTLDGMVDRVIQESGLMRGESERTIRWVVVLASESELFACGRTYRGFIEGALGRLRRRSPSMKAILVVPNMDSVRVEKSFRSLFQGQVSGSLHDPSLAAIDGVFVPDEMAYIACSDLPGMGWASSIPLPKSLVTTRLDAVRDVSRQIFNSPSLAKVELDGITEHEWADLTNRLRKRAESVERRILRLKPSDGENPRPTKK